MLPATQAELDDLIKRRLQKVERAHFYALEKERVERVRAQIAHRALLAENHALRVDVERLQQLQHRSLRQWIGQMFTRGAKHHEPITTDTSNSSAT